MTKSTNTHAPWRNHFGTIYSSNDKIVADIKRPTTKSPVRDQKINANLIVSAPELLNEMKKLAKSLEDNIELPQSFYDAIAKAEGRG